MSLRCRAGSKVVQSPPRTIWSLGPGLLCPGRNLAFIELKVALLIIIQNFMFAPDPEHPEVYEDFAFAMVPRDARLHLKRRFCPSFRLTRYFSRLTAIPHVKTDEIRWRATSEPTWSHARYVGTATTATSPLSNEWPLGVLAPDASAHASVVAYLSPRTKRTLFAI